tara:strand:- start:2223 stop:3041 length:819 start_codon:yes stop_codon:yes gene_type:complete
MNLDLDLSIVFVTYNPRKKFFDRINAFLLRGYHVYIFSNGKEYEVLKQFINRKNFHLYSDNINRGIGYALNFLEKIMIKDNIKHYLYLDQDTLVNTKIFELALAKLDLIADNTKYISFTFRSQVNPIDKIIIPINSGTVFNLKKVRDVGFHDKRIFMDGVDFSFSFISRNKGYKQLAIDSKNNFDHVAEQDGSQYSFFGINHPLLKEYPNLRIKKTISISFNLIFKSFLLTDWEFLFSMIRFIIIYIIIQSYVKFISFLNLYTNHKKLNFYD